jgi:hypothetical protein
VWNVTNQLTNGAVRGYENVSSKKGVKLGWIEKWVILAKNLPLPIGAEGLRKLSWNSSSRMSKPKLRDRKGSMLDGLAVCLNKRCRGFWLML